MPKRSRADLSIPSTTGVKVITFTTDFGVSDAYVAQMKAAVLARMGRSAAKLQLIDVTHDIAPQDVIGGSIALERAVAAFAPRTIHVAVVDPGVGTDRRLLLVQSRGQIVLCPDNGIVTWTWRRYGGEARELTWLPTSSSHTFHGRDILAPVAGLLAAGRSPLKLSRTLSGPLLLDLGLAVGGEGQVIHIDHYGNVMTNVAAEDTPAGATVWVGRRRVGPISRTYGDAAVGGALALIGSAGLVEIAVRNGSAARALRLRVGDPVRVE